jgi:hypothetical protein
VNIFSAKNQKDDTMPRKEKIKLLEQKLRQAEDAKKKLVREWEVLKAYISVDKRAECIANVDDSESLSLVREPDHFTFIGNRSPHPHFRPASFPFSHKPPAMDRIEQQFSDYISSRQPQSGSNYNKRELQKFKETVYQRFISNKL